VLLHYLVKGRRREREEEERVATTRRRNSVTVLSAAGTIAVGGDVPISQRSRPSSALPSSNRSQALPNFGVAEWTGLGIKQALRWKHDGELYSCTGLIWKVLHELGFNPGSIPGPDYWLAPSGRALYYESIAIEDELRSGT
jgi:hypothetical protein